MGDAIKTIENPVLDAYLKYLEDGKTDYLVVLEREAKRGREALRQSAKRRASQRLQHLRNFYL
jgi:hypothetical protein